MKQERGISRDASPLRQFITSARNELGLSLSEFPKSKLRLAVAALLIVAGTSAVTHYLTSRHYESTYGDKLDDFRKRIDNLKEQMDQTPKPPDRLVPIEPPPVPVPLLPNTPSKSDGNRV
jgi:hypothetical protein